jgi:threonine/homoserine/homoserine lactone efflux protein
MESALLKGILFGLGLSIAVGPVIFAIIKQSINNGHKGGFAFVAGVSASDITLVLISQLFSQLIASLVANTKIVGICGSTLLIAVGIYVLFFKKVATAEDGTHVISVSKKDAAKIFLSGYFMNILNPSVIGFWLLIVAPAVTGLSFMQRVVLFTTCLIIVLAADVAKVLLADVLRKRLTPTNIHRINKLSGLILIGFGVALIAGLLLYGAKLSH